MQCYTQLTPPTAVTHSVVLPLFSAHSHELVIARTDLLQIFTLKYVSTSVVTSSSPPPVDHRISSDDGLDGSFLAEDIVLQRSETSEHTRLVLIAEFPLAGTISNLAAIKAQDSKSGGDRLLISVKDTKLSLLEWDPDRYGLATVSIHYYENDVQAAWAPEVGSCPTYLTVDPSSRCAALKFGVKSLAILPFRHSVDADLVLDDYDDEKQEKATSPYSASFVLSLTLLDPHLTNPIHLAFLHEYREPTFGVIFSSIAPAIGLLPERRDVISYSVITLDLEQRASTTILSIQNLPFDIAKLVPLSLPIGGALLMGSNELIHVDQAGRTNGVAVNEFAKQATSFGLANQADLGLKLENCQVQRLDGKDLLLFLQSGEQAIISFNMDGRSVSGLSLRRVNIRDGDLVVLSSASCVSFLGKNALFVGSEDGDSVVLGWHLPSKTKQQNEDEEEMDDDDIYGDTKVSNTGGHAEYVFSIHERLMNLAPMHSTALGKPAVAPEQELNGAGVKADLELVTAFGQGACGGIAVLKKSIEPVIVGQFAFEEARGVWTIRAKRPTDKSLGKDKVDLSSSFDVAAEFDKFMIVSKAGENEESGVYALTANGFEALLGTEFDDSAGATVEVGTLGDLSRIVQVLKAEIRCYDGDFNLIQITPMSDEDEALHTVHASFSDPYVLLVLTDHTIKLLQCDNNGEIDEIELPAPLTEAKWMAGCMYKDSKPTITEPSAIVLYLMDANGSLHMYDMGELKQPLWTSSALSFLPAELSSDLTPRRGSPTEEIVEILVAELGDDVDTTTYLIFRTSKDDIILYKPFHVRSSVELKFQKVYLPSPHESDERSGPLRVLNCKGYSTVFVPGKHPRFILKSARSPPRLISLCGTGVIAMSGFHTTGCERGFVYLDTEGIVRVCQMPDHNFEIGWAVKRIFLSEEITAIAYHPPSGVYAVCTVADADFELPRDDDYHKNWATEEIMLKPRIARSSVKLLSPLTWTIIDSYELEESELALRIASLTLETSEVTHSRSQLLTVGTAITSGIDLAAKGSVYVFNVVRVVPFPGKPETAHKLKLVSHDQVKGAVTAVCGVSGFVLAAQGQKVLVRGLKEDNSLLPVAFMDMESYVSVATSYAERGMILFGDGGVGGLWFAGFSEEPYKMTLFGKDVTFPVVAAADFLPAAEGNDLNIVAADYEGNIKTVGFEPEHPHSLRGHILLPRTSFHCGHEVSSLHLLPPPPSSSSSSSSSSSHHLLLTHQTGSLALLTPLTDSLYRRLTTLTSYLHSSTYTPLGGLNPRAYRASTYAGVSNSMVGNSGTTTGGVIDGGGLGLALYDLLSVGGKVEVENRVGSGEAESLAGDVRTGRGEGACWMLE